MKKLLNEFPKKYDITMSPFSDQYQELEAEYTWNKTTPQKKLPERCTPKTRKKYILTSQVHTGNCGNHKILIVQIKANSL